MCSPSVIAQRGPWASLSSARASSPSVPLSSPHGGLLVGSALAGALLLLVADTIARTVVSPVELPLGVVTAVIGAPIFVVLLRRTRSAQGGWA